MCSKKFQNFWSETNTFNIFHIPMMKVKNTSEIIFFSSFDFFILSNFFKTLGWIRSFYFHHIWNLFKVLVSLQKKLNFFLLKSCIFRLKVIKREKQTNKKNSVCHFPSPPPLTETCAPPTTLTIRTREQKFWLPESFRPTWCPAY
jgi:hypothetical protein